MPWSADTCLTQSSRSKASPSWEVPIPDVIMIMHSPGALSYVIAVVLPAKVVPASVPTMAPWIAASEGRSWSHIPGSVRGC